ncbi:MAG TPA: hypothetical protein VMC85_05705 [Desulfomonilaceae bacterium]|nr:hypothetical protein [Desulfomonilaceae bacterium]
MKISEQAKTEIVRLIAEGECLDSYDLEAFYLWVRASYEALEYNPLRQEWFDEYCRSCCDSTSVRLSKGLWMLRQALYGDASDDYKQVGSFA